MSLSSEFANSVEKSLEDRGRILLHSPCLLLLPRKPSRILWARGKKFKEGGGKFDAENVGISRLSLTSQEFEGGAGRVIQKFFHETRLLWSVKSFKADQGRDRTTRWQCCTIRIIGLSMGKSLSAGAPPGTAGTGPPPNWGRGWETPRVSR